MLFTITATTGGIEPSQVAVLDLRTGTQKILLRGGSQAQYVPSGHLVYAAAGTLRAVAFDLDRLEAIGTPVPVLPQVVTLPTGTAEFDIARDGTLVYVSGGVGAAPARTLVWVDRQGHEEAIKAAPARAYVVSATVTGWDARGARHPRSGERYLGLGLCPRDAHTGHVRSGDRPGAGVDARWTPPGVQLSSWWGSWVSLLASGRRNGHCGASDAECERSAPFGRLAGRHTRRVRGGSAATADDVMMLTLDKDRRVQPLVQTPFVERNGEISPDGRWLAYESNDSGQFQISVRPFPDVNKGHWQVSTGGGTQPLWARNGQELFYLAPNGALMSVRVERGTTWTAGTPTTLIDGQYYVGVGHQRRADVRCVARRQAVSDDQGRRRPRPSRSRRPASSSSRTGWRS